MAAKTNNEKVVAKVNNPSKECISPVHSRSSPSTTTTSSSDEGKKSSPDTPGYEMVKPKPSPTSKDASRKEGRADGSWLLKSKQRRKPKERPEEKKDKSKLPLVCAILITTLVLAAIVLFIIWYHHHHDEDQDPLPNLTEFCQKSTRSMCSYYHYSYAPNCKTIVCDTVNISVEKLKNSNFSSSDNVYEFDFQSSVEKSSAKKRRKISVPDFTPCEKNRWCISGDCEPTDDSQIIAYSEKANQNVSGMYSIDCNNDETERCFNYGGLSEESKRTLERCTKKECYFYWNEDDFDYTKYYRVAHVTCNNPFPLGFGEFCWTTTANIFPVVAVTCSYCEQNVLILPDNCEVDDFPKHEGCVKNCSGQLSTLHDGFPCSTTKHSGICFLSRCVPYRKDIC